MTLRIEYMALTDLMERFHGQNPKDHNVGLIEQSISTLEYRAPVMIDERSGKLAAGHGRIKALADMQRQQMDRPPGIQENGDGWLVPVVRGSEFTAEQLQAYLVADNNLTIDGGWHEQELATLLQGLASTDTALLEATGYSPETLDELLHDLGMKEDPPVDPGAQVDRAAELQKVWDVQNGQIWQLGKHRILCGDSCSSIDIMKMVEGIKIDAVVTDPPYGMNFDPMKERGGLAPSIPRPSVIGDDDIITVTNAFKLWCDLSDIQVWWGANHYSEILPSSSCWLVWDKVNGENDFSDCEIAWTNQPKAARLFRHMWNGMLKDSERGERRVHATQKPVELFIWVLKIMECGEIIADPFLGSGSSLMACEALGKTCIGIEIFQEYCAVILQRWEDATGQRPELISVYEPAQ